MEEVEKNGNRQIYGLMASVLADVESVGKGRRNEAQGYQFRGIDDVYAAVHPLFAKHGIFTLPRVLAESTSERTTASGTVLRFVNLTMAYDFFAPDGSHVTAEVVGEAMDAGDKASNKAMSAAQKYALIQTLCIPTGEAHDSEKDTYEVTGEKKQVSKSSTANDKCPKCEGAMWDNRETKRNPKAPDYKCKNKACDGAVWLNSDKTGPIGNDKVLRDQLFDRAEKLLSAMPLARRQAALGRLVKLDTDTMAKSVAELSENARKKSQTADPKDDERQAKIKNLKAEFPADLIADTLRLHYGGASIEDLPIDELDHLYADLIPF